jgi:transcriptional regulator GlxA family with amidase domain
MNKERTQHATSAGHDNRPALSVGFILLRNFTLLPFAAIVDALRLAADEGDFSRQINCNWTVIDAETAAIPASCGIEVAPWEPLGDPTRFDYIVVVGGLLHRGTPASQTTLDYLVAAADAGVTLVGVCTGAIALARAGLLRGRRCCVSWFHYNDLVNEFPEVVPVADQLFVVDGKFITCAGGVGAVDLAGWIIERHLGPAWAQKSLHILVADQARPPNAPQPQPPVANNVRNPRVRRAVLLIEQNLAAPLSADEVADRVNISKRQLERLFRDELGMGVQAFARYLRLHYGLWLLLSTERRVTDIALECGFSDTSHFNRLFRRTYGVTPSAVRNDGDRETFLERLSDPWGSNHSGSHPPVGPAPNPLRERRPYV